MSEDTNGVDLLSAIKNYLKLQYSPASSNLGDVFYMSTGEITRQLLELYPTHDLTSTLVAEWMHELGFTFIDNGNLQLEWKMAKFE